MWKRSPEVDNLLHASEPRFKRIRNPDNPRLYKLITVYSYIFTYLAESNPERTPAPEPLDAVYSPGPASPGKSKSGKRSKKKPKKRKQEVWMGI